MKSTVNLTDSYSTYTNRIEEGKTKVNKKLYLEIVYGFMKFTVDRMVEGDEIFLGAGESLGSIRVQGHKVKPRLNENGEVRGLAPDWVKTKELYAKDPQAKAEKRVLYCFNEHTDGIRYKIVWKRFFAKLKSNSLYNLTFTKGPNGVKRKVSNAVKSGKEYYVVPTKIQNL